MERDTVVNVPRRMMGSTALAFAAAAIFGGVGGGYAVASPSDEFDAHESMHRTGLAMLNGPRRVVTAEDVARIERAKAKRARKAAARGGAA